MAGLGRFRLPAAHRDHKPSSSSAAMWQEADRLRVIRILETSCMRLCPKGGVTALNATRPGTIHVIPARSDGAEAMQTLLGDDTVADGRSIETA
jgi:hypothetical protein